MWYLFKIKIDDKVQGLVKSSLPEYAKEQIMESIAARSETKSCPYCYTDIALEPIFSDEVDAWGGAKALNAAADRFRVIIM